MHRSHAGWRVEQPGNRRGPRKAQAASDNWVSTITAYGEEERRTVTLGHVCFISFASKMHEIA